MRAKLIVVPHAIAGLVDLERREIGLRCRPPPGPGTPSSAARSTTPGVVVESTELTAVAPSRLALLMSDVSELHSFGSMMLLPVVTVFAPTASAVRRPAPGSAVVDDEREVLVVAGHLGSASGDVGRRSRSRCTAGHAGRHEHAFGVVAHVGNATGTRIGTSEHVAEVGVAAHGDLRSRLLT